MAPLYGSHTFYKIDITEDCYRGSNRYILGFTALIIPLVSVIVSVLFNDGILNDALVGE